MPAATRRAETIGALARAGTAERSAVGRFVRRWGLAACVCLAIAVRIAGFLIVGHPEIPRGQLSFWADEASFHDIAKAVATTGAYSREPGGPATAFRPPGATLPLAALYYVLRPTPYVAFAYVMLCGVAVVLITYRLASVTCGDERVAVAAALLAALLPTQVFTSTGIWSEPQAMCLTLLVLYLLIRDDAVAPTGENGRWSACAHRSPI